MSLDAQGALAILKQHDEKFYNSLHEEHSDFIPLKIPLSQDNRVREYWESKIKAKDKECYPIYYYSKLDALTFFVGLEARDTQEENVRAQLGNLKAGLDFLDHERSSDQYDDVSEQILHLLNIALEIQKNYPLAGSILIAQLYYGWALEHKENPPIAKIYARQAQSALCEATTYGYGEDSYRKHVAYDPRLLIDKEKVLLHLERLGLLTVEAKIDATTGSASVLRTI